MSAQERLGDHDRHDGGGHGVDEERLILPLDAIDRTWVSAAGGKAANLGEMIRAEFTVPDGFCVSTAAYALVAGSANMEAPLQRLSETRVEDAERLTELAAQLRSSLLETSVPDGVAEEIVRAYQLLGDGEPVAVRSSATAEDLPHTSFAGQQESYLNVTGAEAVIDAVRRCWASLWTDRAVGYRAANGIDHRSVRLAVVVQRMVEAEVAGILFSANPLSGRRRQAVIDATRGLGEAVVSGRTNPDRFIIDTASGEIVERSLGEYLGDKRAAGQAASSEDTKQTEAMVGAGREEEACLSDDQVRTLTSLGAQLEAHFGEPQDIEWAIDAAGRIWLVQSRPITTLFPLPAGIPPTDDELRVYFSGSVAQGVYRPLTPMGLQAFRLIFSAMAALAGHPPPDPCAGPAFFADAGGRLFLDVTPVLRSTLGRRVLGLVTQNMEARTSPILQSLAADPRLAPVATRWRSLLQAVLSVLVRGRVPLRGAQAFLRPAAARSRVARLEDEIRSLGDVGPEADAEQRLRTIERLLQGLPQRILAGVAPVFATGLGTYALAGLLVRGLATDDERQTVLRGLPHNPTTEMDLALWALAQEVRHDPTAAREVRETPPERLAQDYRSGNLSPKLQAGLMNFLSVYGHRGVAEIDLGLPRWSEDPAHILGVLASYLRLDNPELAPDVQFRLAAHEAQEMVVTLTRRAGRKSRPLGAVVGFCLKRTRALAGLREVPKFYAVLILARARSLLWEVGRELAGAGRLEKAEDIFFVTLPEARAALTGRDLRSAVHERRAAYERELDRRHVPRIVLSDGTEPEVEIRAAESAEGTIPGTAVSSGRVTATARVILDPAGAHLEPGEILVAPSTDPGWTPLFLTAGGLVMEMGGPMSHGAIVAREFGIPAVVGVAGATEHIATGQRLTVDGSTGTVEFEE